MSNSTDRRSGSVLSIAVVLLLASVALGSNQRAKAEEALKQSVRHEAALEADTLSNYFERAQAIALLTAQNPAFRNFYLNPAGRVAKVRAGGDAIRDANAALAYLERLYPRSIGEACFIDKAGAENARAVRGELASLGELSPDETEAPFFGPTFALDPGQVYQARPYISPDTHEWVISNSTLVPMPDGSEPAIVHYEVTIESFRRAAAQTTTEDIGVVVVEAVAVCDAYEAMTSDRPYRAKMSREDAAAELRSASHTQFDPHVVQVFLATCVNSPQEIQTG
jgi:hypothetical protein